MAETEDSQAEGSIRKREEYKFYCPTKGKEGTVGLYPAGEICPGCKREKGMGSHKCNVAFY